MILPRNSTYQKLQRLPANQVDSVIASLKRIATKRVRDGMARYAIPSDKAFGVSVGTMRQMAKKLGRSHALAEGLWETGWYQARTMAAFVDDPSAVTTGEMDSANSSAARYPVG